MSHPLIVALWATALVLLAPGPACAGPLLDKLAEHRPAAPSQDIDDGGDASAAAPLPPGVSVQRDLAYGGDANQRLDVYLPARAQHAPVVFMVHGGAWRFGDKASASVVDNKISRWSRQGIAVVSINYRMLPSTPPLEQARDVARALAFAQAHATSWGADPAGFVLMGHSAGAHLVTLLTAAPALAAEQGAGTWLGTVALDSAAYDVPAIMNQRHLPLYDRAFGKTATEWATVSPLHRLDHPVTPLLAVCSTKRSDSCPQAARFVEQLHRLNVHASVLEEDLSHRDINLRLGQARVQPQTCGAETGAGPAMCGYTEAVEAFMARLDPRWSAALTGKPAP